MRLFVDTYDTLVFVSLPSSYSFLSVFEGQKQFLQYTKVHRIYFQIAEMGEYTCAWSNSADVCKRYTCTEDRVYVSEEIAFHIVVEKRSETPIIKTINIS